MSCGTTTFRKQGAGQVALSPGAGAVTMFSIPGTTTFRCSAPIQLDGLFLKIDDNFFLLTDDNDFGILIQDPS